MFSWLMELDRGSPLYLRLDDIAVAMWGWSQWSPDWGKSRGAEVPQLAAALAHAQTDTREISA